ncbi:helix-turn-helix domain-containing protein [Paenibacillus urinalis]|uniref:Helix-turn-helix domain-containing protein n=1 Tax=Paenibacillus urinalis TaxID=521520 RepID=A0ABY7XFI0_9BACL|nr:helix-turn-helix domain-containing protein [Paenibacillus urinalis]WDH96325.1 helix-turn-helix domain-containing protein [Paenibacillus urinalis]WDI04548.1 helix-turn-helix domain-containing protein [Paenibacillus urinalis]
MHQILLVDYSRYLYKELEQLLRHRNDNYTIRNYVFSSSAALEAITKSDYSVIVVNTERCDTAALWLCHNIRKFSQIPILLMGGRDHFRLVRKALTYQVNDYLPFPVCLSSFLHSLHGLIAKLDTESSSLLHPMDMRGKRMDSCHVIHVVKTYVREHLCDDITLKKISDMLHFNCAYLGQKFKLEEKMSFNDYMLQQRMEKAKLLLSSTRLRNYEIALEVGYKDLDWFYKKFKAYTGSSPNAYRRQTSYTA